MVQGVCVALDCPSVFALRLKDLSEIDILGDQGVLQILCELIGLLGAFGQWRRYDDARQALVQAELEAVLKLPGLARDLFEVATKLLAAPVNRRD